jgi:geranylgeranyl pyrophosphate synthase
VEPEAIRAGREGIDVALRAFLEEELPALHPEIVAPIRYAVLGPGKRVRPLLLLAAYRAAGGRSTAVEQLACSVELVHAYSLVHDDLPCMDDDVLRRGRPTVHVRFGVRAAVLAGASLMPLAILAIVRAAAAMELPEMATRRLVEILTGASGARGMVGGQLLDLRAEGRAVERSELERIHTGKTARLIAASVSMGGVAAGASEEHAARLDRFGLKLGLAFQAIDDILDLRGTTSELGKVSGRDEVLRKATYPALFGVAEAERISRQLVDSAARELEGLDPSGELRAMAAYIVGRSR